MAFITTRSDGSTVQGRTSGYTVTTASRRMPSTMTGTKRATTKTRLASGLEWCRRSCSEIIPGKKCTLASLAKKFGIPARSIAKQNGVTWNTRAINAWVIKVGGSWAPLAKGAAPMPGSPPGKGWALLSPRSKILLPACKPGAAKSGGMGLSTWEMVALGAGALVVLGSAFGVGRKGRKKNGS